jgi:hypothetical protein
VVTAHNMASSSRAHNSWFGVNIEQTKLIEIFFKTYTIEILFYLSRRKEHNGENKI